MKHPTYEIEEQLIEKGYKYVIGIDEVGRGPGAGPVVACAVYMPVEQVSHFLTRVRDSKKLSEKKREQLYDEIVAVCDVGIGYVDNQTIDDINILQATIKAMNIALNRIKIVDYVIVDGNMRLDVLGYPYTSIVGGDNKSISIAAASIVAKVYRDDIMTTLHWAYPEYNWLRNKGYLTMEHRKALEIYGPTDLHRMSFLNKILDNL
jgi:ribonuclease HII